MKIYVNKLTAIFQFLFIVTTFWQFKPAFSATQKQFEPSCREVLIPPQLIKYFKNSNVNQSNSQRVITEILTEHFRKLPVQRIPFWKKDFIEKFDLFDFFGHPIEGKSIQISYRISRWRKKDKTQAVRITILSLHVVLNNGELPKDGSPVGLSPVFYEFLLGLVASFNQMAQIEPTLSTIEIVGKSVNPSLGNFFRKRGFQFEETLFDKDPLWGFPISPQKGYIGKIELQIQN